MIVALPHKRSVDSICADIISEIPPAAQLDHHSSAGDAGIAPLDEKQFYGACSTTNTRNEPGAIALPFPSAVGRKMFPVVASTAMVFARGAVFSVCATSNFPGSDSRMTVNVPSPQLANAAPRECGRIDTCGQANEGDR